MNTPQGQQIRQDAKHAAESLRTATEQTVQEVRPQLISALEQLNNEMQKLINRMNERNTPPPPPPAQGS
jgi:DNA anti-recombination protein RmuC